MSRRGVIMLSEGRSGTNWVGSLCRNAGLGNSREWLDQPLLGPSPAKERYREFFETALDKGSSEAGFYVKVFPRQLLNNAHHFGHDFVRYCVETHQTSLLMLERRDRMRQAISFSRGLQSMQWTHHRESRREPIYDFDQICHCYFLIGRSYEFWRSYTSLLGYEITNFVYEELLDDPMPFVRHVAKCMEAPEPDQVVSELRVQRDATTEEWLERFQNDLKTRDYLGSSGYSLRPKRSLSNLNRFLRNKEMKV